MFSLPESSKRVIANLSLPENFKRPPRDGLTKIVVDFTGDYQELVTDLSNSQKWTAFKVFVAERCESLKITDLHIKLYENEEYPIRLMFAFSFIEQAKEFFIELAEQMGFSDIARQKIDSADQTRLKELAKAFIDGPLLALAEAMSKEPIANEEYEAAAQRYWQRVHCRLPLESQLRVERDCQYGMCIGLNIIHNAISVMSNGESLTSLVRRALRGGSDADDAMCKAVRVDGTLRKHPQFMLRYYEAVQWDHVKFLRKYNKTGTPFTFKDVRHPGHYFLMALLDGFGLLGRFKDSDLLNLSDHAGLHSGNTFVSSESSMSRIRNTFLKRKFQPLSMQST